jgi:hypothetical protein
VAFEVCFENEERWELFRSLPAVRAAVDGVPDPTGGLLVYRGRGGGAASWEPRKPKPAPGASAISLPGHPAVTGAAVVGAPDDTWVEAVTAFVTLRPGVSASEDELRQAVRTRLAGYKVPKTVWVIDAIPMSPVGKVLRRALRDPLWPPGPAAGPGTGRPG